jgi:excisionase family DNA binding protein
MHDTNYAQAEGTVVPRRIYNTEEAAQLLQVDRRTLYKEIEAEEIKAKRLGKGYRILGEHLLSYMGSASVTEAGQTIE